MIETMNCIAWINYWAGWIDAKYGLRSPERHALNDLTVARWGWSQVNGGWDIGAGRINRAAGILRESGGMVA